MNRSARAATALCVGYALGRRRRLRTAAVMAAATAIGGTSVGELVLRRGMKVLGSTEALGKLAPQLGDIADTVRGDLLTAGKAAASAALSSRLDTLTDSIHERAESVRNPGAAVADGAGRTLRGARRAMGGEDADDREDADDAEDLEDYEDEPEEPEGTQPEDTEPEDTGAGGRRRAVPARRAGARRSPVTRAGR